MKRKAALLLPVLFLLGICRFCAAQTAMQQFSAASMPAFVRELQQGPPSEDLKYKDPVLYQRLLQRRAVLTGILQTAVAKKQLPQEALLALNPVQPPNTHKPNAAKPNVATTANFALVKDVNASKDANPNNYNFTYAPTFAVLNNVVYYAADDGIHGTELWRSDGTSSGTNLVKDINAGSASGYPYFIAAYNGKIYFRAYTDSTGYELYQSNGTKAGTVLLKDLASGAASSNPMDFTIVNNTLYFITSGYQAASQIWKTDGTKAGTVIVADLYNTSNAYEIGPLASAHNLLFFTAYSYFYGAELWRSDGTSAGTYMLKDINPTNNDNSRYDGPANLTDYNNKLYFSANVGYGRKIWQTDGTIDGTVEAPYDNGIILSNPSSQYEDQPFAIAKNSFFFAASSPVTGTELYKYNPSNTAGVVLVKDISNAGASSPLATEYIRSMNDSIYFLLPDSTGTAYNLWKSGGTAGNTKIVKTMPGYINDYSMNVANNKLYFSLFSAQGYEPWVSNGSAAGTVMLKDINPGAVSSFPALFTSCNNKVFFRAYAEATGSELWITDGTAANTTLVKNTNNTSTPSGVFQINDKNRGATVLNDVLIFNGNTHATGDELWKSDGTAAGTSLLKDLIPGENSGYPEFYANKNGKVYFTVLDSIGKLSVYFTNGTAAGTKKIAVSPASESIIDIAVADNDVVFYLVYLNGFQLWRTDSTGNNYMLTSQISSDQDLAVAGNNCYFQGYNNYGNELWKSNGTVAGTGLVADIYPGYGSSYPNQYPNQITPLGNKIIFTANNGTGTYLWVSNGTAAGTKLLSSTISSSLYGTAILNNKLYFNGYTSTTGSELYRTDGTPAGTVLVKDINTGTANSSIGELTTVDSNIYFSATSGTNAEALWKTNGNAAGTKIVKTNPYDNGPWYFTNLTGAGGKLYFNYGLDLWVSDGTTAGTTAIADEGSAGVSTINFLVGTSNKLFISGYNYKYGDEFYAGDATQGAAAVAGNAVTQKINTSGLTAQLVNNPIAGDLKLSINSPKGQQVQVTVYNYAGQQMVAKTIALNAGANYIAVDAGRWISGMYIVNIVSDTGNQSITAVK